MIPQNGLGMLAKSCKDESALNICQIQRALVNPMSTEKFSLSATSALIIFLDAAGKEQDG